MSILADDYSNSNINTLNINSSFRILSIKVRIGSTEALSGGIEYNASSFNSHPFYDDSTYDYDVGIVAIDEGMDLDGTNARAITLAGYDSDVADGEDVVVTGWGATSVSLCLFSCI